MVVQLGLARDGIEARVSLMQYTPLGPAAGT